MSVEIDVIYLGWAKAYDPTIGYNLTVVIDGHDK